MPAASMRHSLMRSRFSFVLDDGADLTARQSYEEKRFLYDVVANARNGVDVDKLDYMARDCANLGIASSLKHDRLIKCTRVIDNEIWSATPGV
jgi:HD superfamily phosphohydrolase